jgi:hypothetical protein
LGLLGGVVGIDAMEAGRELDVLVAEKVMGARWIDYPWHNGTIKKYLTDDGAAIPRGYDFEHLDGTRIIDWNAWQFSTDISEAWELVEKLTPYGGKVRFMIDRKTDSPNEDIQWRAMFSDGVYWIYGESHAPTAELAICRSALKVAMREVGVGK